GGALEGAGIGLGFAMANQMVNQAGAGTAPAGGGPRLPPTGAAAPGATTVTCGGCKAEVAPGKFCAECGLALVAAPPACTGCGKPVAGKFCAECGTPAPA